MIRKMKAQIRIAFPWLVPVYSSLVWTLIIRPRWRRMGMQGVFRHHYVSRGWGSLESLSGTGSTMDATVIIRSILPPLLDELRCDSILDIPCGDFNWMMQLELSQTYVGADIVPELIQENLRFETSRRSFKVLNLCEDSLPRVDLVLCRDCLFHLSYADILRGLQNVKRSGSKFLLVTTNPNVERNHDIVTGEYRRLNLMKEPIRLPQALKLFDEGFDDKQLGLWLVSDLPD